MNRRLETSPLSQRRATTLASLSGKKGRERHGIHLVEGRRAVSGALSAGAPFVELVITHEASESDEVLKICQEAAVPVRTMSARWADRIANTRETQGMLAVVRTKNDRIEALLKMSRLLVLDSVQDPGNAGTLIRTAAWLGIDGVILTGSSADLYNPKLVRSTAGALWSVGTARHMELVELLDALATSGFDIWAADLEGTPVESWRPEERAALIVGSEAHGLSPAVTRHGTRRVTIDRVGDGGPVESLNVAASGAILMHRWMCAGAGLQSSD